MKTLEGGPATVTILKGTGNGGTVMRVCSDRLEKSGYIRQEGAGAYPRTSER